MARKRGIKAAVMRTLAKADNSIDAMTAKALEAMGEVLDGVTMETSFDLAKRTMVSRFVLLEDDDSEE